MRARSKHIGLLPSLCILILFWNQIALAATYSPFQARDGPCQTWSFGHGSYKRNPLWRPKNDTDALVDKTRPRVMAKEKGVVDTSGGIGRALDQAGAKAGADLAVTPRDGRAKKGARGSVGLSMAKESSTWKVNPGQMRADEFMPRDNRHVVRAFADVKAGDDLDIRVGPELHLRDESRGAETAHEKQPDSSLGVGMQFKLDF